MLGGTATGQNKESEPQCIMSTLRKQTRSGYTHISNELINAEGLSFRAKGIAMVLLSKPDDWEIKIPYLMRVGKEGEKAIRTAMQELAEYGFLMRDRVHENGKVVTVTRIADYPAFINVGTVERRINGYQPPTDLAVSDTSGSSTSQNRHVRKGEVLVIPELQTTDEVRHRRKKRGSFRPPPDIDPLTSQ
jgi:hypothetical protein